MDLAVCTGDGLAAEVATPTFLDVNISMLPADGSGVGLSADASVSQSITMALAAGGGGTALVPTLSITSPPVFASASTAVTATSAGTALTPTWNHTISGSDTYLFVWITGVSNGTNTTTPAVSCGGNEMTLITTQGLHNLAQSRLFLFGLQNPPAGSQAITTDLRFVDATDCACVCTSLLYTNVASIGDPVSVGGTGTALSQSVTTDTSGQVVIHGFGQLAATTLTSYSQTSRRTGLVSATTPGCFLIGQAPGRPAPISFAATGANAGWGGIALPVNGN
jgi:hypothetical protein